MSDSSARHERMGLVVRGQGIPALMEWVFIGLNTLRKYGFE